MQYNTIVYILSLCGFLDSAMAKIFDIPPSAFTMMQTKNKRSSNFDPIVNFSVPQMIQKEGFPVETHIVQTKDGYLLSLHRIPGKNQVQSGKTNSSLPVLVLHAFLTSSADWVIQGKDNALAFMLADRGYDVWLGNFRGNTYSRAHVSLNPESDSEFWNFSFHEMGIYDLPAMISYITNTTSQSLHAYIGFSMSTITSYIMAAEYLEIAQKVRIMISFAPAAYLKHMKSPVKFLLPIIGDLKVIFDLVGQDEFLPHDSVIYFLSKLVCETIPPIQEEFCSNLMFLLFGFNRDQFNIKLWPIILKYTPAGTSTKTMVHLAQLHNSGKFRQYDYGVTENRRIYNTSKPPEYNLVNITEPFAVFYGENDWLADVRDVEELMKRLPNIVYKYKVPSPKFGHLDFIWSKNARELVYEKALEIIEEFGD